MKFGKYIEDASLVNELFKMRTFLMEGEGGEEDGTDGGGMAENGNEGQSRRVNRGSADGADWSRKSRKRKRQWWCCKGSHAK
ncbi:hypothetical protein CRG98_011959 [Punica granatum]|nr:hypothetical protein CRG98_011959 [Punica granatum]